jgi:hypothetical protein
MSSKVLKGRTFLPTTAISKLWCTIEQLSKQPPLGKIDLNRKISECSRFSIHCPPLLSRVAGYERQSIIFENCHCLSVTKVPALGVTTQLPSPHEMNLTPTPSTMLLWLANGPMATQPGEQQQLPINLYQLPGVSTFLSLAQGNL